MRSLVLCGRRRRRLAAAAAGVGVASAFLSTRPAQAQVVERNLPPASQSRPEPLGPAAASAVGEDDAPIGPAVRAIVLLDAEALIRAAPPPGVSSMPTLLLAPERATAALRPFLGRPLSRRLIAETEAAVAFAYRAAGYPFVAVTLPEQEVTAGSLQLRAIEFHVGSTAVAGARTAGEAADVAGRMRLVAGRSIFAPTVTDDLDWLNRDPFRKVQPVFSRGSALGLTDVRLQVANARPWSVYAGYADSGSPSTGMDRYFAGGQAAGLLGFGSLVSYQATASGDALFNRDRPLSAADRPRYVSQAARVSLTPTARLAVEIAADFVESNQPLQDFIVGQRTFEVVVDVRSALSNVSPRLGGWGDVRLGVAAKRQETGLFFGAADVRDTAIEDYQLQLGYGRSEVDRYGRSDLDVLVHLSPGGVDVANSAARVQRVTEGRLRNARYTYLAGYLDRITRLPSGCSWRLQAIGQYVDLALPGTEQVGIGGSSLVRGYTLDDGAYDRALVLRNELHAPAFAIRPGWVLAPYSFFDAGWASAVSVRRRQSASSVGGGLSAVLAGHLNAEFDVARALTSAPSTHDGDWRLESRISIRF